jgi:hypothetical protein
VFSASGCARGIAQRTAGRESRRCRRRPARCCRQLLLQKHFARSPCLSVVSTSGRVIRTAQLIAGKRAVVAAEHQHGVVDSCCGIRIALEAHSSRLHLEKNQYYIDLFVKVNTIGFCLSLSISLSLSGTVFHADPSFLACLLTVRSLQLSRAFSEAASSVPPLQNI